MAKSIRHDRLFSRCSQGGRCCLQGRDCDPASKVSLGTRNDSTIWDFLLILFTTTVYYSIRYSVNTITYTVYCILYSEYFILYTVDTMPKTVYTIMYATNCILQTVKKIMLYSIFYILYTVNFILHDVYCVLYTVNFTPVMSPTS